MKTDRILKITQETDHKFLNFYTMRVRHRGGKESDYFMASRASDITDLKAMGGNDRPDGVAIFAVYGPARDKVVLIRQFRYPLGDYIYEFPAGLMEEGEDMLGAAVREFYEETGMALEPVDADPMYMKPRYMTIGMTDESCATVYGYTDGVPSNAAQEASEDITIVIADKAEVRRILQEENVALLCAYQLMHFLSCDGDPLAFLEAGRQ